MTSTVRSLLARHRQAARAGRRAVYPRLGSSVHFFRGAPYRLYHCGGGLACHRPTGRLFAQGSLHIDFEPLPQAIHATCVYPSYVPGTTGHPPRVSAPNRDRDQSRTTRGQPFLHRLELRTMKPILERIRKYLGSTGRRNRDRAQPEPAELPPGANVRHSHLLRGPLCGDAQGARDRHVARLT